MSFNATDLMLLEASNNVSTDIFSGIAGLSSIGGGFEMAYVDHSEIDPIAEESTSKNLSDLVTSIFLSKTKQRFECGHFTKVGPKLHFTVDVAAECRFWTEGVLSSIVAAFGLIGNMVSIWVLSVPEMRNSFNRLLMALAIIDSLFIIPGILIYMAKAFNWQFDWYNYIFPVFLYPFSEMALCSSIYMTVAIAVERYIGLCRPMKRLSNGRGPIAAKAYIIPVVFLAIFLNVPKFFESKTVKLETPFITSNTTTKIKINDFRLDPYYITYYWMWTRLLATGVIPLVVLALLNSKIYMSIRQSKQQLRILAIRSALPMAILGQSAPSVPPLSDLLNQATNDENPTTSSPMKNGNGNSTTSSTTTNTTKNGKHKRAVLTMQKHIDLQDIDEENAISKVPESPNGSAAKSKVCGTKSLGSPHGRNIFQGKIINGRLRQMQRSVSAFTSNASNNELRANKVLRTQSSSASTHWSNGGSGGGGGGGGSSGADMKLAPILFGVVIVFILCNSLRVALNVYDFSVVDEIIKCEKSRVGRLPPAWVLCSISVSHLLLMVNSSVNFLVYCVAGTRFRRILMRKLRVAVKSFSDWICCGKFKSTQTSRNNGYQKPFIPHESRQAHHHHHHRIRMLQNQQKQKHLTASLLLSSHDEAGGVVVATENNFGKQ